MHSTTLPFLPSGCKYNIIIDFQSIQYLKKTTSIEVVLKTIIIKLVSWRPKIILFPIHHHQLQFLQILNLFHLNLIQRLDRSIDVEVFGYQFLQPPELIKQGNLIFSMSSRLQNLCCIKQSIFVSLFFLCNLHSQLHRRHFLDQDSLMLLNLFLPNI